MSTLKTNTIQHLTSGFNNIVTHTDGAGTVNAAHCRAWVNFDGTGTPSIRANFNVSSITDNGTGDYTVNITNALSDANYAVVATTTHASDNTNHPQCAISVKYDVAPTTTSCRFRSGPSGGSGSIGFALDTNYGMVAFFR